MSEANWVKAFGTLRSDYNLSDDSIGIFAIYLKFGLDDVRTIASESITGGGDDKKCDVLYVDKEREIAVIAQCYVSVKHRQAAPSNKASDLNTALTWLLVQDISTLPDVLKGRADELRTAINSGEVKQLYIWYVHNLPSSENVARELQAVEQTARSALRSYDHPDVAIFAQEVSSEEIDRLYTQAERTIIVTDKIETYIYGSVEVTSTDWQSLMTAVKGEWLNNLYNQYQTDLFSANLRGYLGSRDSDSNINNGIKSSARSEPKNFFVYNNGLTALVLNYSLGRRSRGRQKLTVNGISIVNGAQTTGSLSSTGGKLSPDIQVGIRFVKAMREDIVENIVRFNNSQNKLQAADFRSTDPIQDRLRIEFENVPDAEYEGGRRGGASDIIKRSKFTLPSYTVGQSLAAFHGDPVTAYDKKSELWTNEKNYRHIFTDRTTARHIVFCYSLLNSITKKKIILAQQLRNDSSSLTAMDSAALNFLQKKGANYLFVYATSQCMEIILARPIPNKSDLYFSKNISPDSAEFIWSPIIDLLLPLSLHLEMAFSRNRISVDTVSKAVPAFVAIIASLANTHRTTFKEFASNVRGG